MVSESPAGWKTTTSKNLEQSDVLNKGKDGIIYECSSHIQSSNEYKVIKPSA